MHMMMYALFKALNNVYASFLLKINEASSVSYEHFL
jgi:hypothetical protein